MGKLVLSRKVRQEIHISGGIVIRVTEIKGAVVRLAFEAPAETKILRGELGKREAA